MSKSVSSASCNASVCDESIVVDGHCFCKSDVENLLLESFKFRRIFLEYHKISLDELNDILGVNKTLRG